MSLPTRPRAPKTGVSVDSVISAVLMRISTNELNPGEQLRQEDLADELGISRVPVREALHALTEQRVLIHHKNRGFFVAKRSPDEIAQFVRMLELIEDEVLASIDWPAAEMQTELCSINDRMRAATHDDLTITVALNREFHFAIFALSPRRVMIDELTRLWRLAQSYIAADMVTPESRLQRVEEHDAIIERLAQRDRLGLIRAMDRHRLRR